MGQLRVDAPQREVSIGLLKVIEKEARERLTPVAPFAGFVETTVALVWERAELGGTPKKINMTTRRTGVCFVSMFSP